MGKTRLEKEAKSMNAKSSLLFLIIISLLTPLLSQELVYAEMEFPLSFVGHLRNYKFNPLAKFQTEIEGRIIELTCDPLVDIYEVRSGQLGCRPCLANWRTVRLRNKKVLNFNLIDAAWSNHRPIGFEDVWFALEYKKLSDVAWSGNQNIVITSKGAQSFDATLADSENDVPKPGEFAFPLVNRELFNHFQSPKEAKVNKAKQTQIGYGRYIIDRVEENRYIRMRRRSGHPYFHGLVIPQGYQRIENIRMQCFPKARINRNEQFIEGRVHLITSLTQADRGYIINSYPDAKISSYSDDSFSCFLINCRHPYLKVAAVRKALNYAFRKRLALQKALGGEGEVISGPLPKRNFFYNLRVPPYQDSLEKALATMKLYCRWGMDVEERGRKVFIHSVKNPGPAQQLAAGDHILSLERHKIFSVVDLLDTLEKDKQPIFRAKIVRGQRIFTKRLNRKINLPLELFESVTFRNGKVQGIPPLTLIANNPEGKNPLVKEICGALKEDLAKLGITLKIDYLNAKSYYPRLQQGKFDFAYRTVKLTGTPNIYRMFYFQRGKAFAENTNYGGYYNKKINRIARSTKDLTDILILKKAWKKAHKILHLDPPCIFLWSRRHIIMYDPRIKIMSPGPRYRVPYGYTKINGLINIFNEVHLWAMEDGS